MSLPQSYYVVNDFVLVQPAAQMHTTPAGIITPNKMQISLPSVTAQPEIIRGYVVRRGDGYPLGETTDVSGKSTGLYMPLRVEDGDEVYFMKIPPVIEISLEGNTYFLIKQGMILVGQSSNFE
jgi:co-chaperonin GroES (HSP10)